MTIPDSPLAVVELACAALSAIILVGYVLVRPPLVRATKLALLLGLGVFPIGAAFSGNVHGFEGTKERRFCGSCHTMVLHASDSDDPKSQTLSAQHARNKMYGSENCYTCHANYGMFGTIVTKAGGMRHVWLYLTEYRDKSIEEDKKEIRLLEPAKMNSNCMQCHSSEDTLWLKVPEHVATLDDTRAGRLGCASAGCHGLAHPYWGTGAGATP